MNQKRAALKAAFPYTLPICAGFTFLGLAYGIYMNSMGFSFVYPMVMSLLIFAGSMEFVTVSLLVSSFHPLHAFLLALMVNARHLFYGISMLDKYRGTGKKKFYLIFGMCDESFTINCYNDPPAGVDKGWFMFFVTLLNHCYWFLGSTLGGLLGSLIHFNTEGINFVMTALFVVIFMDQWFHQKEHVPAILGVVSSTICLVGLGSGSFIVPSMILILLGLTLLRGRLQKEEGIS